jgi:hypothetical protein
MVEQELFLHLDNTPVYTAAAFKNWLPAREIHVLPHRLIHLASRRRTSSCSGRWRRSWLASTWPMRASKMPEKRSWGPLSKKGLCHCFQVMVWAKQKCTRIRVTMLKKLKNKRLLNSNGCLFIKLFKFNFDSTSYCTYTHSCGRHTVDIYPSNWHKIGTVVWLLKAIMLHCQL